MIPIFIERKKTQVDRLREKHRVSTIWLIGSHARGDATSKSDIDFLVTYIGGKTTDGGLKFTADLQKLFNRKIDVVSKSALRKRWLPHVIKEAVYICGVAKPKTVQTPSKRLSRNFNFAGGTMSPRVKLKLEDMLDLISRLYKNLSGVKRRQFLESSAIQDAVMWNLYQVSDMVKTLPDNFKENHPEVDWGYYKDMRNSFAHEYQELMMPEIWKVIGKDIPMLESQIRKILKLD